MRTLNEKIRDAVLGLYIDNIDATAESIAAEVGCSVSTIRKAMREEYGCVPGTFQECQRPAMWVPCRRYLAELVSEAKMENKNE